MDIKKRVLFNTNINGTNGVVAYMVPKSCWMLSAVHEEKVWYVWRVPVVAEKPPGDMMFRYSGHARLSYCDSWFPS